MSAKLETLMTAFDAHARAELALDADPRSFVRAENRLLDAAVDCGMSMNEPVIAEWAATRLTRWLVSR